MRLSCVACGNSECSLRHWSHLYVVIAGAASDERLGQDRPVSAPRLEPRTFSPVNGGIA